MEMRKEVIFLALICLITFGLVLAVDEPSTIEDTTTIKSEPTTESLRKAIVSKDDIESARGRALNLNSSEQQGPGVLYVTAPSVGQLKGFDLSDVSMDEEESMDSHKLNKGEAMPDCSSKDDCEKMSSTTHASTDKMPEHCTYNGKKYAINERIENGCETVCRCLASNGLVECEPRCPKVNHTAASREQCVSVPDPKDACCHIELCDVTLDDHEQGAIVVVPPPPYMMNALKANATISNETIKQKEKLTLNADGNCEWKGKVYTKGMQFHEGCEELCVCTENGVHCEKIDCPSTFGLELMDPQCLEWAPEPATFRAIVPKCCPERMRCVDNGTCEYKGQYFENWSDIPTNLTGCEQHCFCERGKVECRPACQPVPSKPPKRLRCDGKKVPKIMPIPNDECCRYWACAEGSKDEQTPFDGISGPTLPPPDNKKDTKPTKDENGIHPLYPSSIDNPSKGVQVPSKPTKKATKTETKFPGPFETPSKPGQSTKYDFNHYDDVNEHIKPEHDGQPGPGFFNPSITKHQYPDYDQTVFQNGPPAQKPSKPNQFNPYLIPPGGNRQEIFNILGGNIPQNVPPHLLGSHIEHLLQQIQENGGDGGEHQVPPYGNIPPNPNVPNYPFGQQPTGPVQGGFGLNNELQVVQLEAINSRTVRIVFVVSPIFVNLHGRVEIRYTKDRSNDSSTWQSQVFAPPDDLIATSQLEFDLSHLEPNTEYRVKIILSLQDINSQPSSKVYRVQTPPEAVITPPSLVDYEQPQHPAIGTGNMADVLKYIQDPELHTVEVNSTWARLAWRKLVDEELIYVDGIQLRYREVGGIIYDATPLIHRTINSFVIEHLKPEMAYEFGLYFIPFPGHGAELRAGEMIQLRTAPIVDVYGFDVNVNVTKIKTTSVEVSWDGVPYPEDKYVNIYRTIVQSDSGKEDSSVFKVAKRDSSMSTLISELKPSVRYRLWIEVYLTNGNIKKSNVVDFTTKPGPLGKTGKLYTETDVNQAQSGGDYYGSLVFVSIIAVLSIMSTFALLYILTRRHGHQTAAITPKERKNDASYDNPSYKVELQQETMNL